MKMLRIAERGGSELHVNTTHIWWIEMEANNPSCAGQTRGTVIRTDFGIITTDEILSSMLERIKKETE